MARGIKNVWCEREREEEKEKKKKEKKKKKRRKVLFYTLINILVRDI